MEQSNLKNNYIKTYDNVFTQQQCQHLIDKFEDSTHQQVKITLEKHMSFTDGPPNRFSVFSFCGFINKI